jgi:DNA-binding NtrC family response regulator
MFDKKILLVKPLGFSEGQIENILQKQLPSCLTVLNQLEASREINKIKYDLVLIEEIERGKGMDILKQVVNTWPGTPVIFVTNYGDVNTYLEVMNLGAYEHLTHPRDLDKLPGILNKIFLANKN